jgi:hypothetical protein
LFRLDGAAKHRQSFHLHHPFLAIFSII